MSQKRFLEALILDFGGVLYPIDYDAPVRSFQALGFSNFESFYHKSNQHSWFDELEVGRMEPDVFLESLRGHCRKGTQLEEVVTAWNSILLRMPAGRVEAVQALGAACRLFLFSNTNAIHASEFELRMEEDRILGPFRDGFEAIHYSHELGYRKPHPASFKALCELHGLNPQRTGFVDDSIQHVEGARRAGLHAVHYHPAMGFDLEEALRRAGWMFS